MKDSAQFNQEPTVVTSTIQEQGFPPPPLTAREMIGYQLSHEENVEQFSETDSSYPNLSFNKDAYLRITSSPRYHVTRLHTVKKYRLVGN